MNNVYGNEYYQFKLELYGYETYIDSIALSDVNLDLGTIIMQEEFIPAVNVFGEDNEINVTLEWTNPLYSEKTTLINENGFDAGGVANDPNEEVWAGNIFENPGTVTLTDVDMFFTFDEGVEDYVTVDILNTAVEIIASSEPFITPYLSWVHLDLPNLTITGDFYIMVHWQDNELSTYRLCYESNSYEEIPNTAYLMWPGEEPISIQDFSGYWWVNYSFLMRANVLDESSDKGTKEALSYNIYRGLADDISNVSEWEMINSEPVLETSFTDDTWPPTPVDNYMYAIEAIYTETDAEVTFSNSILGGTNVSIDDNTSGIKIYPNPAESVINISTEQLILKVIVVNVDGVKVLSKSGNNSGTMQLSLESLSPGLYYLEIETENGFIHKKIIKN